MQSNLTIVFPIHREKELLPNCPYFLTYEKSKCISEALNFTMREKRPFLRMGYCIRDLGDDIGIPAYQLSAYINGVLGMNFNELLNSFRIKYCRQLIANKEADQLNLRGLARQCGFTNRNTLTTAFKKFTGLTPSKYSKIVGRGDAGSSKTNKCQ
ncbi:MAG: helix-turn-helix domain-containing protein [Bacteroidota bacterium]